jgi:hypothetical protein
MRGGVEFNEDSGSGYFDYRKYRVAHELSFALGRFQAILDGKFLHYDYTRQMTTAGEERRRSEIIASLRLEQGVWKNLKVFTEVEQEWSFATDPLERYTATTIWGGLDWQIR